MGNFIMRGHGQDGFWNKFTQLIINIIACIFSIAVLIALFLFIIQVSSDYHVGDFGFRRLHGVRFGDTVLVSYRLELVVYIAVPVIAISTFVTAYIKTLTTYDSDIILYEYGLAGKCIYGEIFQFRYSDVTAVTTSKGYLSINVSGKELWVYTKLYNEIADQIRYRNKYSVVSKGGKCDKPGIYRV